VSTSRLVDESTYGVARFFLVDESTHCRIDS
jgi:hypothetical protein